MTGIRHAVPALYRFITKSQSCRNYASFAERVIVNTADVAQSTQHLTFSRFVDLRTANRWLLWESRTKDDPEQMAEMKKQEEQCKTELPTILSQLSALDNIQDIRLTMSDIIDLPIQHKPQASVVARTPHTKLPRTPITVLSAINIHAECEDVCLWKLPRFPKVRIEDVDVRHALTRARAFPNIDSWRKFVAESNDPLLQAFDFTADFQSRDLTSEDDSGGKKTWVDLRPLGEGYTRISWVDIDDWSATRLSPDVHENMKFLSSPDGKDYWKPDLYGWLRSQRKVVRSVLAKNNGAIKEACGLVFDRPVWQFSDAQRELMMSMLPLEDGEEYVWEEYALNKRKRDASGQ